MTDDSDRQHVLTTVGRRIRDVRERQRISQESLAHEAGLHRTYVGAVERGERNVSVVNLYRLAAALHVAAADLLP